MEEWKKNYFTLVEKPCLTEIDCRELKHKFNLALSAAHQMGKLVHYWGESPQPGSTYYYQKLNHDVFGISIMPPIKLLYTYLMKELAQRIPTIRFHISHITLLAYQTLCVDCICFWIMLLALIKTVIQWLGLWKCFNKAH